MSADENGNGIMLLIKFQLPCNSGWSPLPAPIADRSAPEHITIGAFLQWVRLRRLQGLRQITTFRATGKSPRT
jgi:hypothetical protein